MKLVKYAAILMVALLLAGCAGGYQATLYVNRLVDGNSQHRLLTIGSFSGNTTEDMAIAACSGLEIIASLGSGELEFQLENSQGQVFSGIIKPGQDIAELIEQDFSQGAWQLKLKGKKAQNIRLELKFLN